MFPGALVPIRKDPDCHGNRAACGLKSVRYPVGGRPWFTVISSGEHAISAEEHYPRKLAASFPLGRELRDASILPSLVARSSFNKLANPLARAFS